MVFHGVRLIGLSGDSLTKLLLTAGLIAVVVVAQTGIRLATRATLDARTGRGTRFWVRQGTNLFVFVLLLFGLISIWFNTPSGLTTFLGLLTAGVAFALQDVITAIAGYVVILRGNTFRVGDRIVMGGVRGDVVGVGLLQTTIMEMGQPPAVDGASPAVWLSSRQYTGRLVTVTNDQVFANPIYNYTRDFPYIYDQITVSIGYTQDRKKAESIIEEAVRRHTEQFVQPAEGAYQTLQGKFFVRTESVKFGPRVYVQATANYLNLTARFVVPPHGIAGIKDTITREILDGFDSAHIGIGPDPTQFQLVGQPTLTMREMDGAGQKAQ